MFRIERVVLLAASLCSVATAQSADQAVQNVPTKQPSANGTASNESKYNGEEPPIVICPIEEPIGTASLKMTTDGLVVHAHVHSSEPGFVGVVGLSLTLNLTYSFPLPPLLSDAVVMAFGGTDTQDLALKAALSSLPIESMTLFGQALVFDEKGLWSSNVVDLVIGGQVNGTEPANGSSSNADQASMPAAH